VTKFFIHLEINLFLDLMKQHWKLNDPGFKDLQNRKSTGFPKLETALRQSENKKPNDENISKSPEEEKDKLKDLKKFVDEENERLDRNVESNVKLLSDDKLSHWKESIVKFISDSKTLKESEENVCG